MRSEFKTHKDLDVWNEGIELVVKVYDIVQKFPKEEKYGLVEQMKRYVISIRFLNNREFFSLIEKERYKLPGLTRHLGGNKNVQK